MMMFYRLVRLIEAHSQGLAASLLKRVQESENSWLQERSTRRAERARVYEIYRHLGDWLMTRDESELEARYLAIGAHVHYSKCR